MDEFKNQIIAELRQKKSVLVLGSRGSGKSYILQKVSEELENCLFLKVGPKKQFLLALAKELFDLDALGEEYKYYPDWEDVRKEINKMSIPELTNFVIKNLSGFTICIDDLHLTTEKSILEILRPMESKSVMLLAGDDSGTKTRKERVALMANKCVNFNMPKMTRDEAVSLIWSILNKEKFGDKWQKVESRILGMYDGKPGIVVDMTRQLGNSRSDQAIREMYHSDVPTIDLTIPTIVIILAMFMASRYFARQLDDPSLLIFGGVAYAALLVMRPLLYDLRR